MCVCVCVCVCVCICSPHLLKRICTLIKEVVLIQDLPFIFHASVSQKSIACLLDRLNGPFRCACLF